MADIYISTYDGEEVDLDNLEIYPSEWKEMSSLALWSKGWVEAGKSLFYMQFIYVDMSWGKQKFRVDTLCRELADIREEVIKDSPENKLKMMKWLYRFQDEVENQC